jgi:hypothetical protein
MTRVVANIKLPADVHLHAPGTRPTVKTVEQAVGLIERELPLEMARLSRRLFARAPYRSATLKKLGFDPIGQGPGRFGPYLRREMTRWAEVACRAGLKY